MENFYIHVPCYSAGDIPAIVDNMLGHNLRTKQTPREGVNVKKVRNSSSKLSTSQKFIFYVFMINTVECHYNAVQYCKILPKYLQLLIQNINQMLDPQKTPHTSP